MLRLRQQVFVVEQQCVFVDADGLDPLAVHVVARDGSGRVAGAARVFGPGVLRLEAVIGRVVTSASARGGGFGAALMREALVARLARFGAGPTWLGAQAHLRSWYAHFGFEVCGDPYDEDGIPHLPMANGPLAPHPAATSVRHYLAPNVD